MLLRLSYKSRGHLTGGQRLTNKQTGSIRNNGNEVLLNPLDLLYARQGSFTLLQYWEKRVIKNTVL